MSEKHGYVAWSELMTRDTAAARSYYSDVCGWDYTAMTMDGGADYFVALSGGKEVVGIMDMTDVPGFEDVPPHWFTYLGVADVDEAVNKTQVAGGDVIRAPFDVPGIGRIAIIKDPTGAPLGLIAEAASPEQALSNG
ncbi:VOC family protein [Marivita sp.]|uniref:VOC family protein n=1 Tax=Marivita sp. TaxID=2003365 RepID=UPI0025BE31C4|nr:VOC family protein [Marivita sp.]